MYPNHAQVYKEELCRRHYNSIFSLAVFFRAVTLVAAIILSLAIAFATDGFWKKLTPDLEQPTVHYTGDGLAILEVNLAYTVKQAPMHHPI